MIGGAYSSLFDMFCFHPVVDSAFPFSVLSLRYRVPYFVASLCWCSNSLSFLTRWSWLHFQFCCSAYILLSVSTWSFPSYPLSLCSLLLSISAVPLPSSPSVHHLRSGFPPLSVILPVLSFLRNGRESLSCLTARPHTSFVYQLSFCALLLFIPSPPPCKVINSHFWIIGRW